MPDLATSSRSGAADVNPGNALAILDGIANGTSDLIAAEDAEFSYIFFNAAYAREFRKLWGQELRLGMSMVDAMAAWPEQQRMARDLWARALAGETFNIVQAFGPSKAETRIYDLRFSPVRNASGLQIGAAHIFRDVTDEVQLKQDLSRALAQRQLMLEELDHRIKNLLSVVQAIAHQSMRGLDLPEDARAGFFGRLAALSRAQELVLRHGDGPIGLRELAEVTLAPFGAGDRIRISGPDVAVPGRTAVSLGLAFHELATNAAKYGPLSAGNGEVRLGWHSAAAEEGSGSRLQLFWQERGGPPAAPPLRRGFGLRMIEESLSAAIGGRAKLDFGPDGLSCVVDGHLMHV